MLHIRACTLAIFNDTRTHCLRDIGLLMTFGVLKLCMDDGLSEHEISGAYSVCKYALANIALELPVLYVEGIVQPWKLMFTQNSVSMVQNCRVTEQLRVIYGHGDAWMTTLYCLCLHPFSTK